MGVNRQRRPWTKYYVLKQENNKQPMHIVKKNMTLFFYKLVLLLNLQRGDIVNVLILN